MSEEDYTLSDKPERFLTEVATHTSRLEQALSFDLTIGDDGQVRRPAELDFTSEAVNLEEDTEALDRAKSILKKPRIKIKLCAALKSFSGDLNEIYKPLVKILLPLSCAGVILGPAHIAPITVAIVGIVIARMSVAAYCADERDYDFQNWDKSTYMPTRTG